MRFWFFNPFWFLEKTALSKPLWLLPVRESWQVPTFKERFNGPNPFMFSGVNMMEISRYIIFIFLTGLQSFIIFVREWAIWVIPSSHNVVVYELSTRKCICKSWFWNRVLLLKDHKNNSPCLFNCIFTYLIPDEKAKDDVLCSYLYYNIEWESEQLYPL